jgi:asparagine synthase (glutamine-hydrolysing)
VCGIAGFIQRQPNPEALSRMLRKIAHRGPDGEGAWHREVGPWRVALGHRRLAIIDLVDGSQPMENEDGSVAITYNGEVYNFLELRPALVRQGHLFKSRSDTEVILHHLEQNGIAAMRDLEGMFAFALWDSRTRKLVLARDRTGIKPLYYAELADGGIVFASELSALLAHGGVDSALSKEGVVSYFFSDYVQAPRTIVGNVHKLLPGHTVIWHDGRLQEPSAFWRVATPEIHPRENERALAATLWSRLGRAVESQLISDVPVGIFLSGGIDSSCVATLAATRAGKRMKAFSIGFEDATFDESKYARLVAERLDVEHVSETLREKNLLDVVDEALDSLDEPIADPSIVPTFVLSRLAARHVKVAIGGDGGDELWGGYPTYRAHGYAQLYSRVPAWVRSSVVARAVARLPLDHRYQSMEWKIRRFTQRWDDDVVTRHLRWMSSVDLPDLPRAIQGMNGLAPDALGVPLPETRDWLQRLFALDLTTYLPGSVLAKVDRASMAHGLEVRPPFLDNEMVDWALSLPAKYKVRRGRGKYLLKLAARGSVPDEVIDRPKKGFAIPLANWLRGPLKTRLDHVVARSPIWQADMLSRTTFDLWNREHQAMQKDNSKPLWALFVLDHWLKRRQTFTPSRS